jgi:NodT family efflux transporter outer membrane factor (OMF) lipoprotein
LTRLRASLGPSAAAVGLTAVLLSGCVVGPNYKGPPTAAPIEAQAPAFHRAGDLPNAAPTSRWWVALNDTELDRLMEAALAGSPDLDEARARIVQARAGLKHAESDRLPTTGSSALYLRSKGLTSFFGGATAAAASAQTIQIYTADFDATWEIDLFGGKARAVEGAKAQAEATEAALEGAKVSLEAEVAQTYVSLRQLQQRLALSRRDAEIESRMLALSRRRRAGGGASDLDVEQLNGQLQSTEAGLTPISAQIAEQLDRLAILTGREPGALDRELSTAAALPAPPGEVLVGDPAALLRRRPDIRQAERRLAQSNASIGQHTADLFPKVTLLGTVGYTAPGLSTLFDSSNSSYTVAPFLQWTPFDFGRVRAQIAQARGAYGEALADYRKTVLGALQDAETALARYGRQRENVTSQLRVRASAERASAMQGLREKGGTATTLDVLDTERRRVQAELGVLDAQAQLINDYIALQKSLGLGWEGA